MYKGGIQIILNNDMHFLSLNAKVREHWKDLKLKFIYNRKLQVMDYIYFQILSIISYVCIRLNGM